jgi:hypothetical protein
MAGRTGPLEPHLSPELLAAMAYLADAEREDEVVERSLAVVTAVAGSDLAVLLLESEDGWIACGTLSGAPLPRPLAARLKRAAARWSVAGSRPGPLRGFASTSVHELRVGGARLGYLVAASGSAVEPDGPAADLLDLLARQASAALLAVRLAAEQAARGEVLRAVQSRLDEALWERNRHLEIHEQLTAAAVESERSGAVAQALHRILGVPVVVEDAEGALLAVEGGSGDPRGLSPSRLARLRQRLQHAEGPVTAGGIVAYPVRSGREGLASIWLASESADLPGQLTAVALEHGATALALELERERRLAEAELRLRRDLTEELLEGTLAEEPEALERLEALGVDVSEPARAGVVRPERDISPTWLLDTVRSAGVRLATFRQGRVAFVAPEDAAWSELQELIARVSGDPRLAVGVGSVCRTIADYPRSYEEARRAADLGARTGERLVRFDELGVLKVLLATEDPAVLESFVDELLGPLVAYDLARRTELVPTLAAYLERGGSVREAAAALFIHPSTLKYRLKRIRELSGLDLSDPRVRFEAQLATKARQVLEAAAGRERPGRRGDEPRGALLWTSLQGTDV